jgi:phosphatidylglycerophosphate synthase
LLNTLGRVIPALLLTTAGAWMFARSFGLPDRVIMQSAAVFAGFLLALSPLLRLHYPLVRFGPANAITLLRAAMVALFAGLPGTTGWAGWPAELAWLLALLAVVALILDGIDGWLARRTGMASAFGARFDMEVDALFILVLAVLVWCLDKAGLWVILSGAMRYGFVALGQWQPWLNRPLPPRRRRQTICVAQTVILILCLTPPLLPPWSALLAAGGLALLTGSFTADIIWLWTRRMERPERECPL